MDKTTMTSFVPQYVNHIGSCSHPNGTVFALVTHKVGTGQFNAEIWRDDPPYASAPKLIHTFVFGGPCGYGTLECLPDGSLYVGLPAGLKTSEDVTGNRMILSGVAQPWKVDGVVQLLPLTGTGSDADAIARQAANTATALANQAKDTATVAARALDRVSQQVAAVQTQVNALHVPTAQDIKDIAWSYAGQRIAEELATDDSPMRLGIASISQALLLTAIDYANTHTAQQSHLRGLIETIMGEKHASA